MFEKNINTVLAKYRKTIPEKYNQLYFLDYLTDDDVDAIFSITTRSDGKTYGTLTALAILAAELGITTTIIVRHYDLRKAVVSNLSDIYQNKKFFDNRKMAFFFDTDIVTVTYNNQDSFYIVDLNSAGDLKNYSTKLSNATLTLYDEFLAIGGDYSSNEFLKFRTIFETMDRGENESLKYTNNRRKAIFLANPVDFSSEFLDAFDLYRPIANQELGTIKKYDNVVLEMRKNVNGQENKNNRLFKHVNNNESITGKFTVNDWQLKTPQDTDFNFVVKTKDKYLVVFCGQSVIIRVQGYMPKDYIYNTDIKDNSDSSIYLDPEKFYREDMYRLYNKGKLFFANPFSKEYVLMNYPLLDIVKLAKKQKNKINEINTQEAIFNETQETRFKKTLLTKFLS